VHENSTRIPRRWERQKSTIPVSLMLEAAPLHADDSAFTVDVSLRGVSVRTKLALLRGEWVAVVAKGKTTRSIPALVVWVQKDESSHPTFAGLQFF
jgi:hypothetical protein